MYVCLFVSWQWAKKWTSNARWVTGVNRQLGHSSLSTHSDTIEMLQQVTDDWSLDLPGACVFVCVCVCAFVCVCLPVFDEVCASLMNTILAYVRLCQVWAPARRDAALLLRNTAVLSPFLSSLTCPTFSFNLSFFALSEHAPIFPHHHFSPLPYPIPSRPPLLPPSPVHSRPSSALSSPFIIYKWEVRLMSLFLGDYREHWLCASLPISAAVNAMLMCTLANRMVIAYNYSQMYTFTSGNATHFPWCTR